MQTTSGSLKRTAKGNHDCLCALITSLLFSSNKDAQDGQNRNKSREKPMFLKDYERKLVLERGGELSDDEDQPGANGLSYHETEQKVKEE